MTMSRTTQAPGAPEGMALFERFLSLWVALAIVAGVLLGQFAPALPETLSRFEYAQVSIPVAVLVWAMIFPMMVQIDFTSILRVGRQPKGLVITLVLLFAFQGDVIVAHPLHIVLIAIPLILQTFLTFFIAYGWARASKVPHSIAAPASMIGASNFFELALVRIANTTRAYFPATQGARA